MSSRAQAAIEAGDTLENLVNQFTDPYACLRELIQNSMDAGSTSVSIEFEFKPYESGDKGIMIIHVDDTGEGMNRTIIDTKLTQLFSSSKEDDLTKIGKFGIGFVSVFALNPEAVIVDTGRDGEYWRIFFKKDRTFDRIVLDTPVEGTQIQIIKEAARQEFDAARKRSLDTIVYWCKHTEAEITIDGEVINKDFELESPYQMRHEETDTEIVLAPSDDQRPYFGFYNRGLTLKEGQEEYLPGVQFKIKSRYLEHTLTRDNVLEDENYDKAMKLLEKVVNGKFRDSLFASAAKRRDDKLFGYLVHRLDRRLPKELANLPIVPTLHGANLSINELKSVAKKQKEILWEREGTAVTKELADKKSIPVLQWAGPEVEPGLGRFLEAALGRVPIRSTGEVWALPTVITNLPDKNKRLLRSSANILRGAGSPYKELVPAQFDYPGSTISDDLYIEQDVAGELHRRDGRDDRGWTSFLFGKARGKVLLVNVNHPLIEPHFRLMDNHPALAAYLLAKAVTLDDGLDAATEAKLVEAALEEEKSPTA